MKKELLSTSLQAYNKYFSLVFTIEDARFKIVSRYKSRAKLFCPII